METPSVTSENGTIVLHEKSCGGIVLRRNNGNLEVLLIMHNNTNHWSFPKGHVEEGESELETAGREIFEETGIRTDFIPGFRQTTRYCPKRNTKKQVVYFLAWAKNEDIEIQETEIRQSCWCALTEAEPKLHFKNDKNLLSKAVNYLHYRGEY